MKKGDTIKIAFVDVSVIFKEGLKIVLKKSAKIKVVGEANIDKCFLKFIIQKKPDILLIDFSTVKTPKLQVISDIVHHYSEIKVMALSYNTTDHFVAELLNSGVHGFVDKDGDADIINAIKLVFAGEIYVSETVLAKTERAFSTRKVCHQKQSVCAFTKTEQAIIECICNEMTNKEIADKLFLSARTIEGHRIKILQKIKAKGAAGIVKHAIQHGICEVAKT